MLCEQNTLIEKNASLTFARRLKYTVLCNCEIETDTCACNKHNHIHRFCVLSFYVFFEKYRFQASTELRAHHVICIWTTQQLYRNSYTNQDHITVVLRVFLSKNNSSYLLHWFCFV